MKNKKVIKIIFLIGVILLAVGCALASCKKTHAYDTISTNPSSLSAEDYNPGIIMLFSIDIPEDFPGAEMINHTITIGSSTLGDIFLNGFNDIDDYICYCFRDKQSGYTDVVINFYINPSNQQQRIIEFIMLEEDRIVSAYSNTITIQSANFMALFFMPLTTELQSAFLNLDTMTYNTTQPTFNIRGNVYHTPVASETYINGYQGYAPLYEINYPTSYITGGYNGSHGNLIFTYTNIPIGILGLEELINVILNDSINLIAPYIYQFEVNGYNGGYTYGYQQGLDAADQDAYDTGYHYGYLKGREDGYDDGASGNNAVSSFINILTSIFTGIGAILSIELFPHVTIGLFFLVPLFFGVLGLILWIWRHN